MGGNRLRVAYVRVSTGKQDLESQKTALLKYMAEHGIDPSSVLWLEEVASGAKDSREKFELLWNMVKEGKVGEIYVFELSRLSRSMKTLVNFLYDCFDRGVVIYSVREPWLTDAMKNEIVRPIVIAMLATLYELERKIISERTKAGLERAKMQGKRIGRPPKMTPEKLRLAVQLLNQGMSYAEVAKILGVSESTLRRYVRVEKKFRVDVSKLIGGEIGKEGE